MNHILHSYLYSYVLKYILQTHTSPLPNVYFEFDVPAFEEISVESDFNFLISPLLPLRSYVTREWRGRKTLQLRNGKHLFLLIITSYNTKNFINRKYILYIPLKEVKSLVDKEEKQKQGERNYMYEMHDSF